MNFPHERVINFSAGERDRLQTEGGDVGGRLTWGIRDVAEGHKRKCDLTSRVDVDQAVDVRVHKTA